MSLDLSKLQCLADAADGGKQARCPACAELGQDRKGEHLRIYTDGRFGCCVHPKNLEHRKRIFALAGAVYLVLCSVRDWPGAQTDFDCFD